MNHHTVSERCTVCSHNHLNSKVDFGLNPPANRFVSSDSIAEEERFLLGLGYCNECGTMQLTHRMPIHAVEPRFPWLLYNEPEGHLDAVVDQICKLSGIGPNASVLGLTYKDQSTLDRLTKRGITKNSCLSYTIFQDLSKFKQTAVDLCIARHVIEHVPSAADFIFHLKSFISPNGYLIIEIPDSEKFLKMGNHAFVWEEHISYFTERSLQILANQVQAKIVWFARFPYPYEDALIAVLQFMPHLNEVRHETTPNDLLDQFNECFMKEKMKWRNLLEKRRREGHKIAIFGAGHLSVKWVNFLCLSDLLDCVIDDHPQKVGMLMPGSKLPILCSSALFERGIKICISTLSPESEQKVKKKLARYFDEGGIFIPAFLR